MVISASSPYGMCARSYQISSKSARQSPQEVLQRGVPKFGQYELGMNLRPLQAHCVKQANVAHAHDLAVIGPSGHREAFQPHATKYRTLESPSIRVEHVIFSSTCQVQLSSLPEFGVQESNLRWATCAGCSATPQRVKIAGLLNHQLMR